MATVEDYSNRAKAAVMAYKVDEAKKVANVVGIEALDSGD